MNGLLHRLAKSKQYLRLTPFDTSTLEGRTRELHRRAVLTTASSAFSRLFTFAVSIISLRVALPYLSAERYGVLSAVISFTGFLGFADFGIGNGLLSKIARLHAINDKRGLAQLVSNAFAFLLVLGVVIAIVLTAIFSTIPLSWLFNGASDSVLGEARTTLLIAILLFSVLLPLGVVQRVYLGLQEGYTWHLCGIPFVGAGLAAVLYLPHIEGGIPAFLLATWGMQSLGSIPLLLSLRSRGFLVLPSARLWRDREFRELLSAGGFFFVVQASSQFGWASDSVFISALLGPRAVSEFVVVERLFMLVLIPLSLISTPLWVAYSAAAATGNWAFIKQTLRRSVAGNLGIAFLGSAAIVLFGKELAGLLTAGHVVPQSGFLMSYALWTLLGAWNLAMVMYLNGLQVFAPQFWTTSAFAVLATLLKVTILPRAGVQSISSINVATFVLTILIPFATIFRRRVYGVRQQHSV